MSCSAYFCGIYSAGFLLCCSVDALYCSSVGLGASRCRVCAHGDLIVGEHAPLGALVSQGILCGVYREDRTAIFVLRPADWRRIWPSVRRRLRPFVAVDCLPLRSRSWSAGGLATALVAARTG